MMLPYTTSQETCLLSYVMNTWTVFPNTLHILAKTDLVQGMLIPRQYQNPRPETLHMSPKNKIWLRKEVMDLEKAGIISPSASNFTSPVVIVPKKRIPSTHKMTYRMVANFRKINEQFRYWSFLLMRINRMFSKNKWSQTILYFRHPIRLLQDSCR